MAPIRIAFIGLSANGGWALQAHWPYLKQTSKYQVVGICNSSKESSEKAITALGLPSSTKAYASTDELANDTDAFDLAICAVRVDKHFDAIQAIAAKGKQCYVEWPLGRTLQEAQQLQSTAQQASSSSNSARTIVGLQGRATPIVHKIKQLLAEGAVGRVLSSTVTSSAGNAGAVDPEHLGILLNDSRIGANMLSVHFAHMVDNVLFALGEELPEPSNSTSAAATSSTFTSISTTTSPFHAMVRTQNPTPSLKLASGALQQSTRDTPDYVQLQAELASGTLLSVQQRGGAAFPGEPGLRWHVAGSRGELLVTAPGTFLQIGYDDMALRLHDYATSEVREVDFREEKQQQQQQQQQEDEEESGFDAEALPLPARNVARLYEAFASGRRERYADWGDAVVRHAMLERMVESSRRDAGGNAARV